MEKKLPKGEWLSKDGQIYAQNDGKTIAVIPYFDKHNEEHIATANIMAASKELLSALITCYTSLQTYGRHPIIDRQIEAAIQKATE
jgi:phosphoenolpyruvate carboxylase